MRTSERWRLTSRLRGSRWPADDLRTTPGVAVANARAIVAMRRSRHVVVMIHGFNVPYAAAVGAFEQFLRTLGGTMAPAVPSDHATLVEFHWPGEDPRGSVISAATYSLRVEPARRAGAALGALLATLPSTTTVTLVAHSLGNAALLTALTAGAADVGARIGEVYLLAAAVPARSCEPEGRFASRRPGVRYHALHSDRDTVLHYAFPPGQLLADGPLHGRPRAVGRHGNPQGARWDRRTPTWLRHGEYWGSGLVSYFVAGTLQGVRRRVQSEQRLPVADEPQTNDLGARSLQERPALG